MVIFNRLMLLAWLGRGSQIKLTPTDVRVGSNLKIGGVMRTKWSFIMCGVVLLAGLLAVSIVGSSPKESTDVDYEALAGKLVTQCANIHEGDLVLISGGVRDVELLEDIFINVRKLGASPLLSFGSDRLTRRYYDDVPVKYDSQTPELNLKLAGIVTALISVDYNESFGLLSDVPPERFAAVNKAWTPVYDLNRARNVRNVYLGNGLYPTAALAEQFDVPQEDLEKIFWDGVNVDYSQLQATGEAMKLTISAGKELHITNPNGTDLKMRIEGRPAFVSDGVISADDMEKGGPACQVWLPAGEVFFTPVPGTAEGKVVVDRHFYQGKEIKELTLVFEAGELTSMTAKSGLEPLQARYDVADSGKELFAAVSIGINPNVRLVPGSRMVAWMPAGMVTVGIGNNVWAGGENKNPYGQYHFLPGSTLKMDGKILVEEGKLKF